MASESDIRSSLNYNPDELPRELHRHYISASDEDIAAMLKEVGASGLADLYNHIPEDSRYASDLPVPEELGYFEVAERARLVSEKNETVESYIGDGLPNFTQDPIVDTVGSIRALTTSYTPYQPERSQGTLTTHWIYQCALSQLTGFEAINSSLYDRSTAIFEAICTAIRLSRKANTALIPEAIYPGDLEVVETLARDTDIRIVTVPLDAHTGRINLDALKSQAAALGDDLAAVVYPQVNTLGLLEDVDAITDWVASTNARSIAVIDPMLLATGGLKRPVDFGSKGANLIVGEAQHLAISPNFGGPGLGLFGVRCNDEVRNDIRQTPGRYVGKAKDAEGRDCLVMVLSTREQHIRKDKATSNICSNQAFLATLAGASLLARGESGLRDAIALARAQAVRAFELLQTVGLKPAYADAVFFNEIVLELPEPIQPVIDAAAEEGLQIGVDVSGRVGSERNFLKLSFSDREMDLARLKRFFADRGYEAIEDCVRAAKLPESLLRSTPADLPEFGRDELKRYYAKLGELNVSPDDGCYPLGSCTMKYNPYLNDWAAGLPGFTQAHPQAPASHVQGCLEVLYEIQEWFKAITGLPGVTTQPVAGAQGELVGIKLFQAYHRAHGQGFRDVIFIPASAHGTNFATAMMAGYKNRKVDGRTVGIVYLDGDDDGTIRMDDFKAKLSEYGDRLAGIMITNPNTSGVFETHFREIADAVHAAGGLVYMDGANMNAIAGWCDLDKMGVDAVHNNLHKTWTIPHGGGGPGDAIVGVSERLLPYLPGYQIEKQGDRFVAVKAARSIGSFHRHWGNFAHKVRAWSYLLRLGDEGVRRMTGMAVLSSRYLFEKLRTVYPTLPADGGKTPRMHEFILTLEEEDFDRIEAAGVPRALAITRVGKLFLDFGFHAPTVAWPEAFGLMIEPTESYSKAELDRFAEAVAAIRKMVREHPEVLNHVPLFTPVDRVDDVAANRNLQLHETLDSLPTVNPNRIPPAEIHAMSVDEIYERILKTIESQPASVS